MKNMGFYIGLTYKVWGNCLRTLTRMEMKGICLYKQVINVKDSSRTIIKQQYYSLIKAPVRSNMDM